MWGERCGSGEGRKGWIEMSLNMTARFQPPEGEKNMNLSRVIGLTSLSSACFSGAESGLVCYAAGCVAVLYNPQTNKQVGFCTVTRAISSLCLSQSGEFLAIGERGHQPCITVFETATARRLATLSGHQQGIGVLKFSLGGEYLISIGFKEDKQLILWNWKAESLICSTRLENKVNSIDFHWSGHFFVTCGEVHLKWWYLIPETDPETGRQSMTGIKGRLASILDVHQNSVFVDVICPKPNLDQAILKSIYCLTSTGMICQLDESRLMDKWVQMDTSHAYSLTITTAGYLLAGCTNGRILIYSALKLEYLMALPSPFPLFGDGALYPACYILSQVPKSPYLISTYSDRSMFVWDLTDINQPVKHRSFVFHSSCIWDLQFYQPSSSCSPVLPPGTFFTCGADNMIHIWNLDPKQHRQSPWKSLYSRDLLHSLNVTSQESPRKMLSRSATHVDIDLSSSVPDIELPDRQQGIRTIRCLALHPNGYELACGDRLGAVHVFNLKLMTPVNSIPSGIQAHDAEILTLCYSPSILSKSSEIIGQDITLLASGGRDRLIHIFDASANTSEEKRYQLVTTLDSHSSSVTVTHFTSDGKKFISCSGDKTMVINSIEGTQFHRVKSIPTPHGTINGFALDSATTKFAVSTGQDKRINVWNIQTGKLMRSYRPEGLNSEFYKCCVDPSGMFVATCSFDKQIRIYDFFSGELVHQDFGHSDLITAIKFSPDGKNLISVGGDGCIMVWDLAEHLVLAMQDRLVELYAIAERKKNEIEERTKQNSRLEINEQNLPEASKAINVRTGGMNKKSSGSSIGNEDQISSGVIGKSTGTNSKRPLTSGAVISSPSIGKGIARPSTTEANRKAPSRQLPAWAAGGLNPTSVQLGELPNSSGQNKWAARAGLNSDLQILGKPLLKKDKYILTLELTADETPASTSEKLASSIEATDDVLLMDHTNSDDEIETSDDEIITGNDIEETDILNQTGSNLDKLEESAERLESWLEKKLREESRIDDAVSIEDISFQESDIPPSQSQSVLNTSLSADFFKKIQQQDHLDLPLPPPPPYLPREIPTNNKDSLVQKQLETAEAVSQMRSRLKAMGILQNTRKEEIKTPLEANIPCKTQEDNQLFSPPPPPPFHRDDINVTENVEEDTASTVSGGSDLAHDSIVPENDTDEIQAEELEKFRHLLSDFNTISKRALEAYESLLEKKKKGELYRPLTAGVSVPLSPINSPKQLTPSFSASPRPSQKNCETNSLDVLIHDFENNFGDLYSSANKIMTSSGLFSTDSLETKFSSISHPPDENSQIESTTGIDGKSLSKSQSMRRSNEGSINLENVDAPDVSFILERYSDRLVTLVAEKMLAQRVAGGSSGNDK